MADETPKPPPTSPEGAEKPAAPVAPAAAKPAAPAAAGGEKPVAHAAPPKPAGPAATAWESERVARLRQRFGSGIAEASTYLGQNYIIVESSAAYRVLQELRDEDKFDYCVDVTAVHYPDREKPFEVVWILYSFAGNERMRVKTRIAETESPPSAVSLWPTCNWLERECYDMFGITFDGHPDLRRILLPEEWQGHPLRKDYDILTQDSAWVRENLGIESGQ
ncbi:MAG: NADH-quinone oxidoreductase subunit C [Terriglobales bacterium]